MKAYWCVLYLLLAHHEKTNHFGPLPVCSHANPSSAEATFIQSTRKKKNFETHLNPVMLVLIG